MNAVWPTVWNKFDTPGLVIITHCLIDYIDQHIFSKPEERINSNKGPATHFSSKTISENRPISWRQMRVHRRIQNGRKVYSWTLVSAGVHSRISRGYPNPQIPGSRFNCPFEYKKVCENQVSYLCVSKLRHFQASWSKSSSRDFLLGCPKLLQNALVENYTIFSR